jgi:hypothetical protein
MIFLSAQQQVEQSINSISASTFPTGTLLNIFMPLTGW